jgi:TatA/E family protein of Tat protein translocase
MGWPEIMVILVIALVIFGPRKLPQLGRTLGKALGEFRRATNELKNTLELEVHKEEEKQNAPQRKKAEEAYSRRQPPDPGTRPESTPAGGAAEAGLPIEEPAPGSAERE